MENIINLKTFSFPLFLAFHYEYPCLQIFTPFPLFVFQIEWFKNIEPAPSEGQQGAAQVRDPGAAWQWIAASAPSPQ